MNDNDRGIIKWWCERNFCTRHWRSYYGDTCPLLRCCNNTTGFPDESYEFFEYGLRKIKEYIVITEFLRKFNWFMKHFVLGVENYKSRIGSLYGDISLKNITLPWFFWIKKIE